MDNVDYYMTAESLCEKHPENEQCIEYASLYLEGDYTDTPEKLAAAKKLIEIFK